MSTLVNTSSAAPAPAQRRLSLWAISLVLVGFGLFFAGYLSYTKLTSTNMVCVANTAIFDCHAVETSRWASLMGVPVAYLGFMTHVVIGTLLLLERRVPFLRENGVLLIFGIALGGFAYHCFLTYQAVFDIGKLCPWCLAAHTTMGLQLVVTSLRLRSTLSGQPAA
jgi:uncharacterized membrane protein